ncbi:MAG: hypothetical protein C0599_15655 [Salinivirgaceae bacterium]|nr:MAG: hypothetical protein C0599_15655 [Salinivirgaceae bacterium]
MKLNKTLILKIIISVYCLGLIAYTAYSGYKVHEYTNYRTVLKAEYSKINDIYYGLLSVEAWEDQVRNIVENQIKSFQLNEKHMDVFREEIDKIINTVIDKAEAMINRSSGKGWKGALTKLAVTAFVDMNKLRATVPEFTEAILQTLTREESIDKFKNMALDKVQEMSEQTKGHSNKELLESTYRSFGVSSKEEFNRKIHREASALHKEAYAYGRVMVFMAILFLLTWLIFRKNKKLRKTFLLFGTGLALVILATSVSTPMLEIDARISELNFRLMGEDVSFEEQMIFYQSKSILDVVSLLLQSKPVDSIFVGILILAFSVIMPATKLITLILYALIKKIRKSAFVNWIAFWSGKLSMADVMVVAIFMSYVAFDGIIQNQLKHIDRESEAVKALTTNNTGLQAGFFLFVTYVLFSMLLSAVLKNTIKQEKLTE